MSIRGSAVRVCSDHSVYLVSFLVTSRPVGFPLQIPSVALLSKVIDVRIKDRGLPEVGPEARS